MQNIINLITFIWVLPNNIIAFLLTLYLLQTDSIRLNSREGITFYWKFNKSSKFYKEYMKPKNWLGFVVGTNVFYEFSEGFKNENTYMRHENRHILQNKIFGPLFYALYLLFYLFILIFIISKHPYYDNPFERDARKASGEVVDIPDNMKLQKRFPF